MSYKVSVVIPIYNMGTKIDRCIESIFNQTYSNYEIILVDDGSKDDSLGHCLKIKEQHSNVKVVHTENRGSGPARNTGIENAEGHYVYFPDADDEIDKYTLEKLVVAMENDKFDLVVFGFKCINQSGKIVKVKEYGNRILSGDEARNDYSSHIIATDIWGIQGAPWNKFFRMDLIREKSVEYPPLRRHQDEGFIARYMCHVQSIKFIPDVLYTYYTNDLKIEWDKYPKDYIDAAIGLYETRKDTILLWNPNDFTTHEMIQREYICNVIKSLELSFSPKYGFNKKQRKEWINNLIEKSEIEHIGVPTIIQKYQGVILRLIKSHLNTVLYYTILAKVFIQKHL